MKIKRWLRDGNYGFGNKDRTKDLVEDTDELLERAGRIMDVQCSGEMVGEIFFEGVNGEFYVGTVEFCITKANPEHVKDVIAENEEEAKYDKQT